MTAHNNKTEKPRNGSRPDNPLSVLTGSEDFLWPYRSFAKAFLATQKDAFAYIDANRKLFDEMREIFRKEQDLALEISHKSLNRVAKNGWAGGATVLEASEVTEIFEVATSGWQELTEAWMHVHMRSLDAMRSYAAEGAKSARRTAAAAAT
jgi:hypothetical protein